MQHLAAETQRLWPDRWVLAACAARAPSNLPQHLVSRVRIHYETALEELDLDKRQATFTGADGSKQTAGYDLMVAAGAVPLPSLLPDKSSGTA